MRQHQPHLGRNRATVTKQTSAQHTNASRQVRTRREVRPSDVRGVAELVGVADDDVEVLDGPTSAIDQAVDLTSPAVDLTSPLPSLALPSWPCPPWPSIRPEWKFIGNLLDDLGPALSGSVRASIFMIQILTAIDQADIRTP